LGHRGGKRKKVVMPGLVPGMTEKETAKIGSEFVIGTRGG
jgi:hypothetical protein